ncbi:tetratricopeptide repeat protein [Candidatus Uhrbacteria bacterium]|jgi:tetratricopeptide (TPR) repeat protein|nr:tetratricopeptide repeat protein [Candidatus Uhrbacteria bacterium]MBT7717621.1 tetratricopeptide repeat protein [Candidatus Uhrbacteria bacterium]
MLDVLHRSEHRLVLFFTKSARFFLYAALVLVPLAYLPWTSDALEINKQTVLIFCAIFALLSWLASFIVQKSLSYKKTGLYVGVVLLIFGAILSTCFSLAPFTSLFGGAGQEYMSLLSWLSMAIIFIVGINTLNDTRSLFKVIDLTLIVSAFILLFGALSAFDIYVFTENFIGAPNSLGVLAVMALVMALGVNFLKKDFKKTQRWAMSSFATFCTAPVIVFSFIILYGLDYWFLWALSILGIAIIMSVMLLHDMKHVTLSKILLPVTILVLSLLFAFVPTPGGEVFPVEIAPTYSSSYQIAEETLVGTSWIFGSGLGTFEIDYNQHKLESVNQSDFWNLSFNRSGSHILTILATMGLFGFITYLIVISWIKLKVMSWLLKTKDDEKWLPVFIISLAWIVLATSQIFYSSNITILGLFWIFSAAMLGAILTKEKLITYKKTPKAAFAVSFMFIVCAIAVITTGFITTSRYAADISFAQAVARSDSGETIDEVIEDLVSATKLNKWSDVYARNLSSLLLIKTGELLLDPEVNPESVQGYIANAIYYAQRAVELSPNDVKNQSNLGDVYREVTPFVAGADEFAIIAYNNAIALSPANPVYYVSLGRAHILQSDLLSAIATSDDQEVAQQAQTLKAQVLESAVEAFTSALMLKSDYATAQYYLTLAYERQGNLSDAIAGLEALQSVSPYDAGLAFQLGVLYLQQGKLDQAQVQLEYVLDLSPEYSNARWFLSSVFEQKEDLESAIEQIQFVLIENPENELIISRLERLQAGLVSEEVVEPLEDEIIE